MTVTPYRLVLPLEVVHADEWNAAANFLAGVSNINLIAKTATSVAVSLATQERSVLAVDGIWRYADVDIEAAVPAGPETTYDVVATAKPNKFKSPEHEGEGEHDETDYAFAIEVRAHGTLPAIGGEVAAAQKIGEVDWDGAKIVGIRQLVGDLRSTDPLSPTQPSGLAIPAVSEVGDTTGASNAPIRRTVSHRLEQIAWEVLEATVVRFRVRASGLLEWASGAKLEAEGAILKVPGQLKATGEALLEGGVKITTSFKSTAKAVLEGGLEVIGTLTLPAESITEAMLKARLVTAAKIALATIKGENVAEHTLESKHYAEGSVGRAALAKTLGASTVRTTEANLTANAGDLIFCEGASGLTIELPALAEEGATVEIWNAASGLVTVKAGMSYIQGDYVEATHEVTLTRRQHVRLRAAGANSWLIVAGEVKRTQIYGVFASPAEGTEYEQSETRPTLVVLQVLRSSSTVASVAAYVGTTKVGEAVVTGAGESNRGTCITFIVPPGQKWHYRSEGTGGGAAQAAYLTL
jgi:hypothetical protein